METSLIPGWVPSQHPLSTVVVHPHRVLVKTSTNNYNRWQTERCSDDRNSRSLYTSKVIWYYKNNIPWGKEASVHG